MSERVHLAPRERQVPAGPWQSALLGSAGLNMGTVTHQVASRTCDDQQYRRPKYWQTRIS